MRIIHGVHFEPDLVREYQHVIYQNLIKGMQVLVDARQKLDIAWHNPKMQIPAEDVLSIDNIHHIDIKSFRENVPKLRALWQDRAIRDAYDRRREFQIVRLLFCFTRAQLNNNNTLFFYFPEWFR